MRAPRSVWSTLESGSSLGPYQILDRLGAGGMGEVYLARDSRLGRKAALKVVGDRFKTDEIARRDLLREARMASNLNHPNICTIYDVGEDDGQTYIGMEYLEGRPLSEVIEEGPLDARSVIDYTEQLVDALAYAHEKGVVHRDLKSLNAMVTPEGRVKILDFGLARPLAGSELEETKSALTTLSEIGPVAGTVPYMAPELLRGERADVRSDIWALGVMLYELAAGARPFQGNTGFEVCAAILNQETPPLPDGTPKSLSRIIESCLVKDPQRRYQTARELLSAVEALTTSTPLATDPSSTRRRWARRATALGALVIAVALAPWIYDQMTPKPAPEPQFTATAIFPFSVSGSSDKQYAGAALMDLLSINLDGVAGLRSVDTNALASFTKDRQEGELDPEGASQIAAGLGAELFMLGRIVVAEGQLQARATLYDTDGQMLQTSTARVDNDEKILQLAEDIAKQVLVSRTGHADEFAGLQVSFDALKPFLEAEELSRAGEFTPAIEAYRRAVTTDSLFAMAWARLVIAAGYTDPVLARDAVSHARMLADRLPERERLRVESAYAFHYGNAEAAEDYARGILSTHPKDPAAWFMLGDALLHTATARGLPTFPALDYFKRSIEFGAPEAEVIQHLWWAAGANGQWDEFFQSCERQLELSPDGDFAPIARIVLAFKRGSPQEKERALEALRDAPGHITALAAWNLSTMFNDFTGTQTVARLITTPDYAAPLRAYAHLILAHVAAAGGRWAAADSEFAAAMAIDSISTLEYQTVLFAAPFAKGRAFRLQGLFNENVDLGVHVTGGIEEIPFLTPHADARNEVRAYLLGTLSAELGDQESAEAYADSLDRMVAPDSLFLGPLGLAQNVRAHIARAQGDFVKAVALLDKPDLQVAWEKKHFSSIYAQTNERWMRATLEDSLGHDEEALRWYETLGAATYFEAPYVAPAHLAQARIYERRGDTQQAVEHYTRFINLWSSCDPELRLSVDDARQKRDALEQQLNR